MIDYRSLYLGMILGVSRAVDALENQDYGQGKELMKTLLLEAEAAYLAQEDET